MSVDDYDGLRDTDEEPDSRKQPPTEALSSQNSAATTSSSSAAAVTGSQRGRIRPPPRLGWPAGGATNSVAGLYSDPPACKKPRRATFRGSILQSPVEKASGESQQQQQQQLWTEKYAPKSIAELAVAPKKVKEVAAWLMAEDSSQNNKLLILVGSPGIGKSTMLHCLAREMQFDVHEWTESYSGRTEFIEHLSPLESFQLFLQQTSTGFRSLQLNTTDKLSGSIIVLDELPNLHDAESYARFREILTMHIQSTAVRTILIYSDTVEGKHTPAALERLVEPHILYSAAVQILQIHPPTKARFQKIVQTIASYEGGSLLYPEELHASSGGDLRFAITTLQYEMVGAAKRNNKRTRTTTKRDTKLSSFHALGKLLYAKRQKDAPVGTNGGRPPLEFDPETVVEQSEMEVSGVLHFLEYHCSDFFTDSIELADALGHFSDAAMLVDHHGAPMSSCSVFPHAYASSLAGRAVANANRHPAANKFRQFSAPKVFEVIRKRRVNKSRIRKICADRRLVEEVLPASSGASHATFATDILPFARTILPNHYISSSFLESYFDTDSASSSNPQSSYRRSWQAEEEEASMAKSIKEQEEILRVDDIEDFDDD